MQELQKPSDSFINAFQTGSQIGQFANQQMEQKRVSDLFNKIRQPDATADDYYNAMLVASKDQMPVLEKMMSARTADENASALQSTAPIVFAIKTGNQETAKELLKQQLKSSVAQNDQNRTRFIESAIKAIDIDPDAIGNYLTGMISLAPGGKEVVDNVLKLSKERRDQQTQNVELPKKKADAIKAIADANFAQTNAALEAQKKGLDIQKLQQDISVSKLNNQIALMELKAKSELDPIKKEAMLIDLKSKKQELDNKVQSTTDGLYNTLNSINAFKDAAQFIKANQDALGDILGSIEGRLPAFQDTESDVAVRFQSLQDIIRATNIGQMRGLGALSDAEGRVLSGAFGAIDRTMSEKEAIKQINIIEKILTSSEDKIKSKYGISPDFEAYQKTQQSLSQQNSTNSQSQGLQSQISVRY